MAADTRSAERTLTLSEQEREQLILLLEQTLRDKLVEVHRTEAFAARQVVGHQADVLQGLLDRLR